MHRPGQGREVLSSAVFKPASLSWINKTCVCNQSILNEGKENVGFCCVVFSCWKERFLEEKNLLYAMSF